ncbi:MAG: EamA family transporter, partial [Calditrichaeota bacterium]
MLALFLMSLLFGLTYVASKLALQEIGVFQLVFARYALAWLVLRALVRGRGQWEPIHRRDRREFLLLTAVEPVGYFLCETFALRFTTPATVSLILALIPVFSMLFALVIVNERPHLFGLGGAAICFSGVYAIIEQQPGDVLAPAPVVGSLLALLAAMAAGLYNCLARRLTRRYAPLTLTYYQTLAGAAAFFPLALWQTARQGLFIPGEITLASVLYLALG